MLFRSSVMENKIAKAGDRSVYLRIVEPGGKTLGDRSTGSSTFKLMGSGEDVQFTSTTKMTYDNGKQDLTMSWEDAQRNFSPGNYTVEIYFDGMLGASSSFILK